MDVESLKRTRVGLVREIEKIDGQRAELAARIVEENRRRGVPKRRIVGLKADRAALLQKRSEVREELVSVNAKIREGNQNRAGQSDSVAQHFVKVCREQIPERMFNDLMAVAEERAGR